MAHRPFAFGPAVWRVSPIALWLWRRWVDRAGIWSWLASELLEERERWLLWLPVAAGLGIALYFSLPSEPPPWLAPSLFVPLAFAVGRYWQQRGRGASPPWGPWLIGVSAIALGWSAAQFRTHAVEAPVLDRRGAYVVEGRVLLVEDRVRGERLTLGAPLIHDMDAASTPTRLRFSRRSTEPPITPGDWVRTRAMLMPPSPPSEPFGFDFARQAYFKRLGAVGYSLGELEWLAGTDQWQISLALARLRQDLAIEIDAAIAGDAGAVGVALLTGLRGAIPDHVWHNMQVAGVAHLLAISGLHLGLVAGTLFFVVRIALALMPPLALRLPTKKVAAVLALIGAFGYLLLTGGTVPTQRAFIMTALMLLAVMVDRNPFSMRLVAWAALVVLLVQPESLLGASFQMSFAAVVALIAAYETGVGQRPEGASGLDWRLIMYVGGVALTTIVATLATAPLAVYHFGRLATYGVAANLIAVPLTGFWIMPLGLLGLALVPFGLASVCFAWMGVGIEWMLAVAATVAEWPGAAIGVAKPPNAALIATLLGGLWLCLWRRPWRRFGLLGAAVGGVLTLLHDQPDLLVDARAQIVAVRQNDGRLALSPWKRDSWTTDGWLRNAGQKEAAPWPEDGVGGAPRLRCDALGCIVTGSHQRVALARRPEALEEDCASVDLVISYPRIESCPNGNALLGPRALRHAGGLALWLRPDGIETLSVREVRGDRPWVR